MLVKQIQEVNLELLKEMELDGLLSAEKVVGAINSEDVNSLRDLIINVFKTLEENDIYLENFYYAEHNALSNELFDMFMLKGIKELFNAFGYQTFEHIHDEVEGSNGEYVVGKFKMFIDDKGFETDIIDTMHDKTVAHFVDTKTFKTYELPF
jgi:hypothetical protein